MATLEKIRNNARWLLIGFVGLALFAFVFGDFGRSESTFLNQKKENIIVVNGEPVHYQDFQMKVDNRINDYKRNMNRTFTDDEQNQIRQMVLNEMIDDILFAKANEQLGIAVSTQELADLIMGNNISPILQQMPDFQNPQTRQFDKSVLLQFLQLIENDDQMAYTEEDIARLAEMKRAWLTVEEQILDQQLSNKFGVLVSSAILTNDLEAKALYENNKVSVGFNYVAQSYGFIPDSLVSVSDAEIQNRYNERKDLYKQKEAKVIDYIAVNILPSPADYQSVETKLHALRDQMESLSNVAELVQVNSDVPYVDAYSSFQSLSDYLKVFVTSHSTGSVEGPVLTDRVYNLYKLEGAKTAPDSVKLELLALPIAIDEVLFKNLTDSLIQVVKGGVSFADMALGATNGQSDGNYGWATESQLAAQVDARFKDEVFSAKLNTPFVAKSNRGSFLIQVTEKTAPVKKYKVANIQVHVIPSQETKTRLYNELSQFVSSNHSPAAMRANASEANFNIRTDVEITKDQINLSGIQGSRQVIQWAFNSKKGAISDIYECQNTEYFLVAAVENSLEEGYSPLASVSERVRRELLNEKKGEKLVADLKAKGLTSLEQYAEAMNATPQTVNFVTFATPNISGIGMEPILNAAATSASAGEIAGPYAGKNRVYVLAVTDKHVSEEPYDGDRYLQQAQMQYSSRVYQLMQSSELLRENAKIENNFIRFF
ncbi:MAG: SurA N-terminal domain-containing protein [Dysgonamonadaceae bacterium]|jgi:peptidyl-prolyl cis-trans isomerase D|nr:SurA N-terminal domain-containing protein [Dysgonamonadaceae bacterium]